MTPLLWNLQFTAWERYYVCGWYQCFWDTVWYMARRWTKYIPPTCCEIHISPAGCRTTHPFCSPGTEGWGGWAPSYPALQNSPEMEEEEGRIRRKQIAESAINQLARPQTSKTSDHFHLRLLSSCSPAEWHPTVLRIKDLFAPTHHALLVWSIICTVRINAVLQEFVTTCKIDWTHSTLEIIWRSNPDRREEKRYVLSTKTQSMQVLISLRVRYQETKRLQTKVTDQISPLYWRINSAYMLEFNMFFE